MNLPRLQRPLMALLLLPALLGATPCQAEAREPAGQRRSEVVHLVRQDCGSCHGMTLKGGLGPALLPASLADKPDDSLQATILMGRPGTPMPGWSRFLNEEEAAWIVARLKNGFPEE